ncbi:hypothetical protein PAMA_021230 [Pampus argenteus]
MPLSFHLVCWITGLVVVTRQAAAENDIPVPGCPPGWTRLGSRCFIFRNIKKCMGDAESVCLSLGGNLASIHSAEEHKLLRELINKVSGSYSRTWIGCHDGVKEGMWMWTDGSEFNYQVWGKEEPNNHYGGEHCGETNWEVSGCPPGWTQLGSRCFIFYHMAKAWTDAEHTCISVGGNLASIHNADENVFLARLIERVSGRRLHTWVGGYDAVKEGTWQWSDGSRFDYVRWAIREPNNLGVENCVEMNFGGNYWNDLKCYYPRPFVCAKDL